MKNNNEKIEDAVVIDESVEPNESTITNESNEKVGSFVEPENKGFLNKMSEGGKNILSKAYEGIYKIPVVNRVVAKMGVAYNQFWIDLKEKKSVELKGKIETLNLKSETFNQSKNEIMRVMEDLKNDGIPGGESLLLKIKEIEQKEVEMSDKKDKLQSRIESRENKIKLYTNKRDNIADKMITNYEKKLSPMEEKLGNLEDYRNRLDLFVLGTEAKHEEQAQKLERIKERKNIIEQKYAAMGYSERKIKRDESIKFLEKQIEDGHKKIEEEKSRLSARQNEINNKIAKIDAKANPYRDRKNEFIRIKDGRPIKIDLEERHPIEENDKKEETSSHTRLENENSSAKPEQTSSYTRINTPDNSYYGAEQAPLMSDLIISHNKYLEKNNANSNLKIDASDLFKATKLSERNRITTKKFKEIVKQYYKTKKIPESSYLTLINNIG